MRALPDEPTKISTTNFLDGDRLMAFEYPFIFLDLINYISGVRITYHQRNQPLDKTIDSDDSDSYTSLSHHSSTGDFITSEQMDIAPYKGMNGDKMYDWFARTLEKLKKDDEYQMKKVMNETTANLMSKLFIDQ